MTKKPRKLKMKFDKYPSKSHTPWNKGLKGFRGQEKHHNWKGGNASGENRKKYMQEYNKKYTEENYDRKLYLVQMRRARLMSAEGSHSFQEWETLKVQYNYTCPACFKREPDIKLTEDHIIPLIKGGSNNIENIQPLCRSCNSRKHTASTRY